MLNSKRSKREEKEKMSVYKIVMIGCKESGKTCLVNQFVNGCFDITDDNTKDFREYYKIVNVNKDVKRPQYCILKIVDLFGLDDWELNNPRENRDRKDVKDSKNKDLVVPRPTKAEMLKSLLENKKPEIKKTSGSKTKKFYFVDKKAYGFVFVYDATRPETLREVGKFIKFLYEQERKNEEQLITKKFLIRNKIDLIKDKTPEEKKILESLKHYDVKELQCSALENDEVSMCFETIAKKIYTDEKFRAYDKAEDLDDLKDDKNNDSRDDDDNDDNEEEEDEEDDGETAKDERLDEREDDHENLKSLPSADSVKPNAGCNLF